MEQKMDLLIEMVSGIKQDITNINTRLDVIETHVANIDERLTMTQNIKKLYSDEALKAVEVV